MDDTPVKAKKKPLSRKQVFRTVILVLLVLAVAGWLGSVLYREHQQNVQYRKAVEHAEEMYVLGLEQFEAGNYEDALHSFYEAQKYKIGQSEAYYLVCQGWKDIRDHKFFTGINALKNVLGKDCPSDVKELARGWITEAEAEKEVYDVEQRRLFKENLAKRVPYVGMSEQYIDMTALGKHSKVRHNYQVIRGEQYLANLYDFSQNGKVIFTARCVNGEVYQVFDHRADSRTSSTGQTGSGTKKSSSDPYNAKDYDHPEDFYDWYKDDFWDYEDAEDYWEEHH